MAEEENVDYTGFGYSAIRNALSSSSTTVRIQKLEHLNEEHKRYGE